MDWIQKFFGGVWLFATSPEKTHSAKRLGALTVVVVAIIVVAGYSSQKKTIDLPQSWGLIAASIVFFLMMLGLQVNDRVGGAFIDDRNLMSLSRFQIVAWTVVIVSSFLAMALFRAFQGDVDALNVKIPDELWQLLGITSASAVGRELVIASKKTKTVANADVASMETANDLAEQGIATNAEEVERHRIGAAYGNPSAKDASIVDMFQGDEVGNTAHIDIGKVQMFFFTIAAIVAYASDIFQQLARTTPNTSELPVVGSGLLAILMVSHATYLGNKALDHTSGKPSGTAENAAAGAAQEPIDDPGEKDG